MSIFLIEIAGLDRVFATANLRAGAVEFVLEYADGQRREVSAKLTEVAVREHDFNPAKSVISFQFQPHEPEPVTIPEGVEPETGEPARAVPRGVVKRRGK